MSQAVRRVAIIGASCTGKSSLFNALSGIYQNDKRIGFVSEAARDYFIEHGMPSTFSFEIQRAIQEHAKQREISAASGVQVVISDSSVMEPIFYTQLGGDSAGARRLEASVRDWMRGYELLMCDPADILFEHDGLRSEDEGFRDQLHGTYQDFLEARAMPYTMISGDLAARVSQARQIIGL